MDGRTLAGGLLVIVGILVILSQTSIGSGLGDYFEPDGKQIECQLSIDKDSIHSAVCNPVDTCRTGGLLFFGVDEDVTLRMVSGGQVVNSDKFDTDFGVNEQVSMDGCVPSASSSVRFDLLNEQGGVVATRTANLP